MKFLICVNLNLIVILITLIINYATCSIPFKEEDKDITSTYIERTQEIKRLIENLDENYSINIDTCKCQSIYEECQVSLSIPGNECSGVKLFCCKKDKSLVKNVKNAEQRSISSPRVKIRIPGREDLDQMKTEKPARVACQCKLRKECEPKDTDYNFGYHCPHNKVRCCETIDESDQCVCLPKSGCRTGGGRSRGEDLLRGIESNICPFNLVQCCGDDILHRGKDQDDDAATAADGQYDPKNGKNLLSTLLLQQKPHEVEVQEEILNKPNSPVLLLGASRSREPVQLPELKIPSTNQRISIQVDEDGENVESLKTTLTPPVLPNFYNFSQEQQQQQQQQQQKQPLMVSESTKEEELKGAEQLETMHVSNQPIVGDFNNNGPFAHDPSDIISEGDDADIEFGAIQPPPPSPSSEFSLPVFYTYGTGTGPQPQLVFRNGPPPQQQQGGNKFIKSFLSLFG